MRFANRLSLQYRHALLLLALDVLSEARKGVVARVFGARRLSLRSAVWLKSAPALLYFAVTCLIPVLTLNNFGESSETGRIVAQYHHLIINAMIVMLFYLGLFVGGTRVFELTLTENEQILAYPVLTGDVAKYRVLEVLMLGIKTCIYFVLPVAVLVFLSLGWSAVWTVSMAILTAVIVVNTLFAGCIVLLFIARLLPRLGSDKICIGIFLASIGAFVVAIRSYKDGHLGTGDATIWEWFNQAVSVLSYSSLMDSMVNRPFGVWQAVLCLIAGLLLFGVLWKAYTRSLTRAYIRLRGQADDLTVKTREAPIRLTFAGLNRFFSFLPVDIRPILIKDILALTRRPNLAVKVLIFTVGLAWVANIKLSSVAEPFLLVLYVSAAFVVTQLFLNSIGQERSNILTIKQMYPSVAKFLSARIKIAFGVSIAVLLPLWGVLIGTSTGFAFFDSVWRVPVLIMNVMAASLIVTCYSATFAEFSADRYGKQTPGIHPMAILPIWAIATSVPMFFYKIDLALMADKVGLLDIAIIVLMSVLIAAGAPVLWSMGVRRIREYT